MDLVGQGLLRNPDRAADDPQMPRARQRVLVFCTSFCPDMQTWEFRIRRWIDAIKSSSLNYDQILIVDDGSPVLPNWPDAQILCSEDDVAANKDIVIRHFADNLGRISHFDFPGWYRSFGYGAVFSERYQIGKVIHIESDAYLISDRIESHFNSILDGWVTLWCARHKFPEIAIQVIAGTALQAYWEFARRPYSEMAGKDHEWAIPVTRIERTFKGDRYGEWLSYVPRDADWVTQTNWRAPWPDYFWWQKPEVAVVVHNSQSGRSASDAADLDALGRRYGTDKSSIGHDYLGFYERFLGPIRSNPDVRVLEIGVHQGASLRMWESYFSNAIIVGFDKNPDTTNHASDRIRIEVGDQSDAADLLRVAMRFGPFDLIIDDGSHIWDHQILSFQCLLPFEREGGFYIMENIDTSSGRYIPGFKGIRDSSAAAYLHRFCDYLVGDAAVDTSDEQDGFLRSFPRKTEFMAFHRQTCVIRMR